MNRAAVVELDDRIAADAFVQRVAGPRTPAVALDAADQPMQGLIGRGFVMLHSLENNSRTIPLSIRR